MGVCKEGYFLIELMVSIALISCMGIFIGQLKGYISQWHQEASAYLQASTLADTVLNIGKNQLSSYKSISIKKESSQPFKDIPYESIQVSITIPVGNAQKTVSFMGGRARYDTKK